MAFRKEINFLASYVNVNNQNVGGCAALSISSWIALCIYTPNTDNIISVSKNIHILWDLVRFKSPVFRCAHYWQFNSYQPTSPKRFMPDQDCRVIWIGSGKLKEPVMSHSEGRGVCISVWCMRRRDNSPMAAHWGNRNIPLHHSSAATSTLTQIITVYMQPISKQHHPLKKLSGSDPFSCSTVLARQTLANNVVKSLSVLIGNIQEHRRSFSHSQAGFNPEITPWIPPVIHLA